jgi:serine/threonine protein phosphatase PrpC
MVQDSIAYWAHVGDSRLYLMRNGRVMVQTKDHSRIRLLVEEGKDHRSSRPAAIPDRNKIYSCLGSPSVAGNRVCPAKPRWRRDDILLLCTDGLWGVVLPGDLIAGRLKDCQPPCAPCRQTA